VIKQFVLFVTLLKIDMLENTLGGPGHKCRQTNKSQKNDKKKRNFVPTRLKVLIILESLQNTMQNLMKN